MANVRSRDIIVCASTLSIVTFVDRRTPNAQEGEFLFQAQLEQFFFGSSPIGTTGAFYRLLARAGVGSQALALRRSSVAIGRLSNEEFDMLRDFLHSGVRVFTLVPIIAVHAAIATFGPTMEMEALLVALQLERPVAWTESNSDEESEEGGEEHILQPTRLAAGVHVKVIAGPSDGLCGTVVSYDATSDEYTLNVNGERYEVSSSCVVAVELPHPESSEESEEESDGDDDEDESDGGSSDHGGSGGSSNSGGGGSADGKRDESGSPSHSNGSEACESTIGDARAAVSHRRLTAIPISAQLESQLQAFSRFRKSKVERNRHGKAVAVITAADDRLSILHFLAWLNHRKQVVAPTLTSVFSSPKIGAVAQEFVEEKALTCKYARIVKVVGSLVAVARFTHTVSQMTSTPGTYATINIVDQLTAIHSQCCAEARLEAKFSVALRPKAWLTWEECQRARVRAEAAVASEASDYTDADTRLQLVRECALLKLLTALPPDRVGIYRQLKIDFSLKSVGNSGYQIDLTERDAHKTSEVFGPTRTTVTAGVAVRLGALVKLDKLRRGDYLFHGTDRQAALSSSAWTRFVQAAFKKHSGVALSPKDCRSSFVSWLRSGQHGDAALKAAADAMHHSSAVAASASYDKFGSDRVVAAAVNAADVFARRFTA